MVIQSSNMFLKYAGGLQNTKTSRQPYSKKRQQIPASFQPSKDFHCMDDTFPHSKSYRIRQYFTTFKSTTNKKKSKRIQKKSPPLLIFLHLSTPANLNPSSPHLPPVKRTVSKSMSRAALRFAPMILRSDLTLPEERNPEPDRALV